MTKKSIDSEVLAALHILHVLTENTVEGVNYQRFIKQNVLRGVLDLFDMGYVNRIKIGENVNYLINDRGKEYLAKILKYASKINKKTKQ